MKGKRSALRVTANGAPISTERAQVLVDLAGYAAATRRVHSVLVEGQGQRAIRVRVTRTDIGSRNAALTTRARRGCNPRRSDAQYVANPDVMTYITTERRDGFDSEQPPAGGTWTCGECGTEQPWTGGRITHDDTPQHCGPCHTEGN